MPQRPRRRPLDWRGKPTRNAAEATDWYAEQLRECGVLVDDLTPRYVGAMPDRERHGEP